MSSLPPLVIPGSPGAPQDSSTPALAPRSHDTDYDSDDSELMLIEDDEAVPAGVDRRLVRSVKQDYRSRRGVDFPSPVTPPHHVEEGPGGYETSPERGRPRLDLKAIYDAPDLPPRSPTIATPARRFLSFSPLRAIFPSRTESPPPIADRPHSAHPSPGVSPYSHGGPKNSTFFRSTTSLAATSFLRLPLTSNANKSDSFFARRLFSSKSREKSRDPQPAEALDAWEELKTDEIEDGIKNESDSEQHPQSLMSLVADVTRPEPIKSASPTRVTFADATIPNEGVHLPTVHPQVDNGPQIQHTTKEATVIPSQEAPRSVEPHQAVHPLSLRDRKTPLIQRPPRKKTPTPRVPIYVPPPPTDPIITTVRTRMQPNQLPGNTPPPSPPPPSLPPLTPSKPSTAVTRPSPLGLESFSSQQTQEAPHEVINEAIPIQAPVPARPIEDSPLICRCGSPEAQPSSPALSRAPSPLDDSVTPTRAHFVGRPLPRPPGTPTPRPHIDSTFAPNVELDSVPSIETSLSTCPEGLLIDLADTPAEEKDLTSLFQDIPQHRSDSPPPLIDLDSSSEDISTLMPSSANESATLMPPLLPFSGIADLAFLFSSLADSRPRADSNEDVSLSAEWKALSSVSALNMAHREGSPELSRPHSPTPVAIRWRPIRNDNQHQQSLLD
jgi:hypothetical protein